MTDITFQLRELELRLLTPRIRQNRDAVSALLADEFCEFGSSGRIFDKQRILDALAKESATEISMTDFKTTILAPGIVLSTYRAYRSGDTRGTSVASLRSSIWMMRNERWQMVFHQGTKCSPSALQDIRS